MDDLEKRTTLFAADDEEDDEQNGHAYDRDIRRPTTTSNFNRRQRRKLCRFSLVVLGVLLVFAVGGTVYSGNAPDPRKLNEWWKEQQNPTTTTEEILTTIPAAPPSSEMHTSTTTSTTAAPGRTIASLKSTTFEEPFLIGDRTTRFRDSLSPKHKYITSFVIAGWTNDVIGMIHLITLGLMTRRIPILPPFSPSHIGKSAGFIPFGDVFDVARTSELINLPLVEWRDVKNFTNPSPETSIRDKIWDDYYGGEKEEMGCWSVWMTQTLKGASPFEGDIPLSVNLDLSFTPAPLGHQIPNPYDIDYSMHHLAELAWPEGRMRAIEDVKRTYNDRLKESIEKIVSEGGHPEGGVPEKIPLPNHSGNSIEPEDHVVCYDYVYYSATHTTWEWWTESTPQWHMVGQYLHWSPKMLSISKSLLGNALSAPPDNLPLFITVHIRRNDFSGWCFGVPRKDCQAPLSAYARRVDQVRQGMREKLGGGGDIGEVKVVVMSDEPRKTPPPDVLSPGQTTVYEPGECELWWEEVRRLGWTFVDHDAERTAEIHGAWYPSILDASMLSLGNGFVGTDRSTYSLIAKRRVEEWAKGPTRMVKWGNIGADDAD